MDPTVSENKAAGSDQIRWVNGRLLVSGTRLKSQSHEAPSWAAKQCGLEKLTHRITHFPCGSCEH